MDSHAIIDIFSITALSCAMVALLWLPAFLSA